MCKRIELQEKVLARLVIPDSVDDVSGARGLLLCARVSTSSQGVPTNHHLGTYGSFHVRNHLYLGRGGFAALSIGSRTVVRSHGAALAPHGGRPAPVFFWKANTLFFALRSQASYSGVSGS